MKFDVIKLRIILWSIATIVVIWLFYMAIVPSGKITYINNFNGDNYFIRKLTPIDRVEPIINGEQKIIGEPVYFSLYTPRRFNKATLEIKYRNNDLPIIETGVLVDKTVWRYSTTPIENKTIDQLSLVWPVIKEGDLILLQKEKKYGSINDFLDNQPPKDEIALYNYDLNSKIILPDYKPSTIETTFDHPLRGDYQFFTYIKNEKLDFDFKFADINQNKDADKIELNLYSNNQLIDSKIVEDDGIITDSGKIREIGNVKIDTKLPDGVYKIEVKTNDDIITRKIMTKQSKVSFINKIRLAENNSKNIIIYTDGSKVSAQTTNPAKLQSIMIGNKEINLNETYKLFSEEIGDFSIKKIEIEKDDVILSSDGVFSFSEETFLNPNYKKIGPNTDINNSGIKYILAEYNSPDISNGQKINRVALNLDNAYRENKQYSFMIAIPGLRADDTKTDGIEINQIKIELEGASLFNKIKSYIRNKK